MELMIVTVRMMMMMTKMKMMMKKIKLKTMGWMKRGKLKLV